MQPNPRILVAPLNWGLGHGSRCVPIINELLAQGAVPVLAGEAGVLALLRAEFPRLESHIFTGYTVHYPKNGNMVAAMAWQLPKIRRGIADEHQELDRLIKTLDIQGVISDNRYGLHSQKLPTVLVTHQLRPKAPEGLGSLGEGVLQRVLAGMVQKFGRVWLPDAPEMPLAGSLARARASTKVAFVGNLSRFELPETMPKKTIDLLVLLSGPEPQRSLLETLILTQINEPLPQKRIVLLRGLPEKTPEKTHKSIEIHNHLPSAELQKMLLCSRLVLSRSGYSTLMDLNKLGLKAAFVPTPGQTEQIYLAKRLQKSGIAPFVNQSDFDLKKLIAAAQNYRGFSAIAPNQSALLRAAVAGFLAE